MDSAAPTALPKLAHGASRPDFGAEVDACRANAHAVKDEHWIFGGVQTFDDARQCRPIERADRTNLAVEES